MSFIDSYELLEKDFHERYLNLEEEECCLWFHEWVNTLTISEFMYYMSRY